MSMDYAGAGTKILCQNSDEYHLNWIHDRLTEVHGENKNVDYMLRLRKIIDQLGEKAVGAVGAANDKPEWKAGKLPSTGTVCEVNGDNGWEVVTICGHWFNGKKAFYNNSSGAIGWATANIFRPIPSERDKVIAKAISGTTVAYMCANIDTYRAWAADLYDRNMLSMPDKGEE